MWKFAAHRLFRLLNCRVSDMKSSFPLWTNINLNVSSLLASGFLVGNLFCNDANSAFISQISSIVGVSNMITDMEECKSRAKSLNSYHASQKNPFLIVKAATSSQISEVLRLCSAHSVPIVAYGGGTSLEGQTLTTKGGVIMDMSGMNQIIKLNLDDMDVTVQPGLGYLELNAFLRQHGVWFPLDPGPGASLGGMAACRCSGSTAVKYGTMRDNVLRMTVVMPDGTVVNTGTRARKSAAGYDLTRLFIGSEGTLGIISEITLRLYPRPNSTKAFLFEFQSVVEAASAARDFCGGLRCPSPAVARCELMDEAMIKIIRDTSSEPLAKNLPLKTCLMIELSDIRTNKDFSDDTSAIVALARQHNGSPVLVSSDGKDCERIWRLRKEALWSVMAAYPSPQYECMITDVCVPLSQLPVIINLTQEEILKSGLHCPIVAHAGDGNFHSIIVFNPTSTEEITKAKKLSDFMVCEALKLGGTCTGEHGVGIGKRKYLIDELGEGAVGIMSSIKTALDPVGIMNPDHLLPEVTAIKSARKTGCL